METEEISPGQQARNEFEKLFEKDPILKELDDAYHSVTDVLLSLMDEADDDPENERETLMEDLPELDDARGWLWDQIEERADKIKAKEKTNAI